MINFGESFPDDPWAEIAAIEAVEQAMQEELDLAHAEAIEQYLELIAGKYADEFYYDFESEDVRTNAAAAYANLRQIDDPNFTVKALYLWAVGKEDRDHWEAQGMDKEQAEIRLLSDVYNRSSIYEGRAIAMQNDAQKREA